MNIMTADGVRNFYNPVTPEYSPEHIKRVADFCNHMNSLTIAGWERKYPCNPPLVFEEELKKQICENPQKKSMNFPYVDSRMWEV